VIASILIASMAFVACEKKAEQTPAAPEAAAPAPDAAPAPAPAPDAAPAPAPDAAPAADAPKPEAGMVPPAPGMEPPAAPLPPVPPEAQAAVDNLLSVMTSIADTAKKDTCAEVLAELKALKTPEVEAKLLSTKILQTYPEEVQQSINQANQSRLISVAFGMAAFQKCQNAPEREAIDATIKEILAPIAPPEDVPPADAPAPVADGAAPAPVPAPDAAVPAPAPVPAPAAAPAPAPAPAAAPAPEAAPAAAPAPVPAAAPAPVPEAAPAAPVAP
jgi:2-oxoglutarate dehydrogenase E2 component (dihydrolipoamide succinyltransferase)